MSEERPMPNPPAPAIPLPEPLLTIADAARISRNSAGWWKQRIARGEIGIVKLGKSTRLRAADVARLHRENFRAAKP
jgi:hypothetical protein